MMKRLAFISIMAVAMAAVAFANINRPNPFGKDDPVEVIDISEVDSVAATQDSVAVIAWFAKGDTAEYEISDTRWNLTATDTLLTASTTTNVRIVVTDSTAGGYKIDYTILGIENENVNGSPLSPFASGLTEKLAKKIAGTTIKLETNEFGSITRIVNQDKIKKQCQSIIKEISKEIMSMIDPKSAKEQGLDIEALMGAFDIDQVVENYLKDTNLIFVCLGNIYPYGEFTSHEDASATQYENNTTVSVWDDAEDGILNISYNIDNFIPPTEVKSLISQFFGAAITDEEIMKEMESGVDSAFDSTVLYNSFLHFQMLDCGFPLKIVNQENITTKSQGRANQTVITLTRISGAE